ncbi:MAG: helix-turn-helix transcriptional regulator [Dehalococcoidia bacterium]
MSEGRVATRAPDELTPRQREVMALMAAGKTNFEIAQALDVSLEGAKYHVSEILGKLGVDSREEAVAAWRHHQRPLARLQRLLAPVTAASWLRPALGLGVLAVAVGIGILLVLAATSGDSDANDDAVPAVTDRDPTPTAFPPDNVPASCDADRARTVHSAWGPATGDGPVYASFGPPMQPGQRTMTYYPSGTLNSFPEGWGGREIMVIVDASYTEPITISATRLDGQTPVEFIGPSQTILLPPDGGPTGWPLTSVSADGWRTYIPAIQMPLDAGGCYAIDFTGPGLDQRITFWAELEASGPDPVPPSDPPACGPPPPLVKPPTDGPGFITISGRLYISQAVGRPSLAVHPDLVGREIGRIKWNVRDPEIDYCHGELDGSTSFLPPGAPVHALTGYREDFRVVAETPYGWHIFESAWRDGASTADELLDVRGKVVSMTVDEGEVGGSDAPARSWTVDDRDAVDQLVDRLLTAPFAFNTAPEPQPDRALSVVFQLEDGTEVSRFWFAGPRAYSSGIPVSEAFLDEITALLEQAR